LVVRIITTFTFSKDINALVYWVFSESVVAEIQKKIEDAFQVFDHDRGYTVDVRYWFLTLTLFMFL